MPSNTEIEQLASELDTKSPRQILQAAYQRYDNLAISFSGAEDVVLIDLACKIHDKPRVFTLDTGRLHPETYAFIEQVRNHYSIELDIMTPETAALQKLVRDKGLFSFFEDGHQECCGIRKVEPLRRRLGQLDAWITGQRKDQSQATRNLLPVVEVDAAFQGTNGDLIKFNPLANWSSADVWNYIRAFDVPYNTLHEKGFTSIGCEPCTRATLPNQDEREGRWWWEESDKKECGLHAGNLNTSS